MFTISTRLITFALFTVFGVLSLIPIGRAQKSGAAFSPNIPKTWDDAAMAALETPLADARYSPKQVSAEYYYRVPVLPIYQTYPVYAPGKQPPGYLEQLKQQEPVVLWDENGRRPALKTEADWIKAGESVFTDRVNNFGLATLEDVQNPAWWKYIGAPLAKDGSLSRLRFVIREKGKIEIGGFACASCHTRVMPDGTAIKGAQGNSPAGREANWRERSVEQLRLENRRVVGAPWVSPDPLARIEQMTARELVDVTQAIPGGVQRRQGTSLFFPVQVPDLIGVKDRKYLDRSGLQQHRGVVDLMRYSALNQGMDQLASFGDFIPRGRNFRELPGPETQERYSDEQLYALALYVYSLKPPPNPNKFDALARRGQQVFQSEGCAGCHTPPLYTNNKLTPAPGFQVPEAHMQKYDILPVSVGTDPMLTMTTRRGTGYYKTPSLKGVWYRGPFEHNGSAATLEDWFDPNRLSDDYVPTGFKGYGVKTRAVKGHEFGLKLSSEEKRALIAFLKTL